MADPNPFQADPTAIGGIAKPPYVQAPDPRRLFARRADRFGALAPGHALAPYLDFLGAVAGIQANIADRLEVTPVASAQIERARAAAMPPIDRRTLADDPDLSLVLDALFDAASTLDMPAPAQAALLAAKNADAATLAGMARNVLADAIPFDSLAAHLFIAAGTQVLAASVAATLDPKALSPVATGVCPACGGPPLASVVVGFMGADGARYAVCACCAMQWNEVRVKCLACGSTQGIGYREAGDADEDATIKAEVCDICHSWLKILYQNRNPTLEPLADDIGSLGLDLLMHDTAYRRAGFNPYLLGY
ncbi:formate dehydrogenase accessory protein FdhE [Lichenihabitans sp. Uapishka_5]|uniref:formate dehydrogenase accessory protein FdhE n=1 Tax=Lichenihabitans sp. Uapishka_5 TaxID=3037302 RepID=UPI0029E7F68C|nr:formate dehydrogenase accessory protein FdhE [Lichenihabitans sp. Uapishka_5]MDX7951518.1 formate dehydrogenase accessory protein FdhE [Lichenihabitans sp. Uapishka_5]